MYNFNNTSFFKSVMYLKITVVFLFVMITGSITAQNSVTIEGYIFSEDSLPQNAYLINYRTSRISAANTNGYFKLSVQRGDSMMVNHISLQAKVIVVDSLEEGINNIYIPYRTYILKAITSRDYHKEMENVQETMRETKKEISNMQVLNPRQFESDGNTYDPDKTNPGITMPLFQIGSKGKKEVKE